MATKVIIVMIIIRDKMVIMVEMVILVLTMVPISSNILLHNIQLLVR